MNCEQTVSNLAEFNNLDGNYSTQLNDQKNNIHNYFVNSLNFIDKNLYNDDLLYKYWSLDLNAANASSGDSENFNYSKLKYGEHLLDLQKRLSSYSLQTRQDANAAASARSQSLQRNIYS